MTRLQPALGKMGYMSPEQIPLRTAHPALGRVFCGHRAVELLCMRRLFPADQPEERVQSILRGDYPRPSSLRSDIAPEARRDRDEGARALTDARFATVREFSNALEPMASASRREISQWVTELASDALAERTRMVARLENWSEGPQIPLSSSPFASELPPPAAAVAPHWPQQDPITSRPRCAPT